MIVEKVDIIIAVIKHKLGSPTINPSTGMPRALSGTIEELTSALNTKQDAPLGMLYFCENAPSVALNDPEYPRVAKDWEAREAFRKQIRVNILHGVYNNSEDLLRTILQDLENNILDYFT
ncbi:hypothetical protein FACS189490_12240 [Clostridia bacterium]|nr:hypothetical protein FACS189490_12240 [Clostridia bacterium]